MVYNCHAGQLSLLYKKLESTRWTYADDNDNDHKVSVLCGSAVVIGTASGFIRTDDSIAKQVHQQRPHGRHSN